jgi:hypothetical protein
LYQLDTIPSLLRPKRVVDDHGYTLIRRKSVDDNMALYAQYVTARFADQNHRLLSNLVNEIQDLYKVLKKV